MAVIVKFVIAILCLAWMSSINVEAIPPSENRVEVTRILPASTQYLPRQEAVKSIGLWNILYSKWSLSNASPVQRLSTTQTSMNSFRKIGFEPLFHLDHQDDDKVVANERRSINIPSHFKIYEAVPTSVNE